MNLIPTERDLELLELTSVVNVITRKQGQSYCFGAKGRQARRRFAALAQVGHLRRTTPLYLDPSATAVSPAYSITQQGLDLLVYHHGDERILLRPSSAPDHHTLRHELAVTEFQILLMQAIEGQQQLRMLRFLRERHIVNVEEPDAAKHFTIRTDVSNGRPLFCIPDGLFELQSGEARAGYLLEIETGANGARRAIARKYQGYHELEKQQHYRKLFPAVTRTPFTIVAIAPTASYRDAMRRAVRDKPGREYWRFAAQPDVTAASILSEPIFYRFDDGEPRPLVKT